MSITPDGRRNDDEGKVSPIVQEEPKVRGLGGCLVVLGILALVYLVLTVSRRPSSSSTEQTTRGSSFHARADGDSQGPESMPSAGPALVHSPTPTPRSTSPGQPFRIVDNQVVVDTFSIRYELRDGALEVALDTDLGDAAGLDVSVSRSYWESTSTAEYSATYFKERSSVGEWRKPHRITIDHNIWKREIEQLQRTLAAAGEPFTVTRIADDLDISFGILVYNAAPIERNGANLRGDAVTQDGKFRIVEGRVRVAYPVDATGTWKSHFADPSGLQKKNTYRASAEIPLVPAIDPPDSLAAAASIRRLAAGQEFTVLEVTTRRNKPWYFVQTQLGEGWVNSTALIGKEIVVVR